MYRVLVIYSAIGCCAAMVTSIKSEESDGEQTRRREESKLKIWTTFQDEDRENRGTSSGYFYPIYPDYGNNGYAVQAGYEGYLVPTTLSSQTADSYSITEIATSLLPFPADIFIHGARVAAYVFHLLFVILLGGACMTVICTFTPICTISFFGFGPTKNQVKQQIAELSGSYTMSEALDTATLLVSKAIEKYAAMQNGRNEGEKGKKVVEKETKESNTG